MAPHIAQADTNLEAVLDRLTHSASLLTLDPGTAFAAVVRAIDKTISRFGAFIRSSLGLDC